MCLVFLESPEESIVIFAESFPEARPRFMVFALVINLILLDCDLHKLENFGWCRDRPWRALLLTCPNVKNLSKRNTQAKK